MKELFGLKSFQNILPWLFLLGIILGAMIASTVANSGNFKLTNFILLFMVPLFFVAKGLYKNSNLFFADLKSITSKS